MHLSEEDRLERKRQYDREWRGKNRDRIREQQKAFHKRKREELGEHYNTIKARRQREENPDKVREQARKRACRIYATDPHFAARHRARTIISKQTGLSLKLLPRELVEAKTLQLLVRRAVKDQRKPEYPRRGRGE